MPAASSDEPNDSDSPAECSGCAERDGKVRRLQEELAPKQPPNTNPSNARWWCLMGLGVCLLAVVYPLTIWSFWRADLFNWVSENFLMMMQGGTLCLSVAPYSIVGLVITLHWRRRWQRLAIGLGIAIPIGLTTFGSNLVLGFDVLEDVMGPLALMLPMSVAISTAPLFVARALWRWTIVSKNQCVEPRPVTLISSFLYITMFAIACACIRIADTSMLGVSSTAEYVLLFMLYIGIPAINTGAVFALLLPAILQRTKTSKTGWVLRVVAIGVVSVTGPLVIVTLLLCLPLPSVDVESGLAFSIFMLSLGSALAAGFIAISTLYWMRMLGYSLVTTTTTASRKHPRTIR